jgi:hypothetical protein
MSKPKGEKKKPNKPEKAVGKVATQLLPVKLTPSEIAVHAKKLANLVQERRSAEDRYEAHKEAAKTASKAIEDEVNELDLQIQKVAGVVRLGKEDREIEVYEEKDFKAGAIITKRADTKESVGTRPMTEKGRQQELFDKGKAVTSKIMKDAEKKAGGKKPDEPEKPAAQA